MVWRKSSAMSGFLERLAEIFRALPPELFTPDLALPPPTKRVSAAKEKRA
jgi:LysR family hydrogen peroxide-inducible transcriptional activator